MQNIKSKKGFAAIIGVAILMFVVVIAGIGAANYMGWLGKPMTISGAEDSRVSYAVPVATTQLTFIDKYDSSVVSSGYMQLWEKGTDTSNPTKTFLANTSVTATTGLASDTSARYYTNANQNTNDLYYVSTGTAYYDRLIDDWYIIYNKEAAGTGNIIVDNNLNGRAYIADVGTFYDMNTADSLSTGIADTGTDTIDYNATTGDGTISLRYIIGNSESFSELRNVVFCVGDLDGDLEGTEVTAFQISQYSGTTVGNMPGDVYKIWKQAAGSKSFVCTPIGTLNNANAATTGTYKFDITVTESAWSAEEFEFGFDDLGGSYARQYPSGGVGATIEYITLIEDT